LGFRPFLLSNFIACFLEMFQREERRLQLVLVVRPIPRISTAANAEIRLGGEQTSGDVHAVFWSANMLMHARDYN
jgi:hypothetical protein